MGSRAKKKVRNIRNYEGEDRISSLPDELIHKILSYADAKEAVQTSVLSKRWKLIWTTLPFLCFGRYDNSVPFHDMSRYSMFIRHVLSNRNHQSPLFELKMYVPHKLSLKRSVSGKRFRGCVIQKFIQYAIWHNVQDLDIELAYMYKHKPFKLSTFSSNSLKKLTLRLNLALASDSWDLPALTTLHLNCPYFGDPKLPDSCLTCLPSLRTLCLKYWDLSTSHVSFSLPALTTLCLYGGTLPRAVWDLPALLSLDLDKVSPPENMSDMLSSLVNLKNLTISFSGTSIQKDHFISCPQLLNLNIRTYCHAPRRNFTVSAPKLCNFTSVGIFSITFGVPELENVNIRLRCWDKCRICLDRKIDYQWVTCMLSGLGNAKNLSFDLWSIEALSAISEFLASVPSPFCNLKYVKLPQVNKESSISSALRTYLLGVSPGATIVRAWPQNMIPQAAAVSLTAENVVLQESLAAPAKELVDSQYIHQTESMDTKHMRVQEEHVVGDCRC